MVMTGMHVQFFSPVSVTWLAAGQPAGGGGPAIGRIALVAVAVLAVGAFAVLQVHARSDRRRPPSARRRRYDPSDWRTLPPPSRPSGRDGEAPPGQQRAYRPDGRPEYPPGYDPYPAYEPARTTWAARRPS